MNKRTKGCLWIALGVACLVIMVGVAVVGGLGYILYQQVSMKTAVVAPADAEKEFASIRAKFAGQRPHFRRETGGDGEGRFTIDRPSGSVPTQSLTSIHVVEFNPRERRLVQFTIPFWLVRLAPEGKIRVQGDNDVFKDLNGSGHFSPRDLEALGPGLLLDETDSDGSSVIAWTD
jgi:hypothetical protein